MRFDQALVKRHKKLARTLLYLTPVLLVVVSAWSIRTLSDLGLAIDWVGVDYDEYESFRLLREYLRIDSSYPDGNEIPAAEFLAGILEAEGIGVHLERVGERNANLWAVLPGDDPNPLVLHHHMDVDPVVRPKRWKHPPFGAVYEAPFLYGRGAFDMKGIGIAQLMAVLDLQRSGARLRRSLMLLATGDEERDSYLGTQRVLAEHPEWGETMWAVFTEGGAVEALDSDDVKYWGVEFQQKRFVDVWVCASDRQRLEDVREDVHQLRSPRRVIEETRIFFPRYGPSRAREETRELLARPDELLERIRTFPRDLEVPEFPPILESMTRDEAVAFPVEADPEGGFRFRLIVHLLPDAEFEPVFRELVGNLLVGTTYHIEVANERVEASPLDHPAFVAIESALAERYPSAGYGPLFVPWSATDARYFRQAGIPTYGFSPFLLVSSDAQSSKGANERIPAPSFIDGAALYLDVVRRLVAARP